MSDSIYKKGCSVHYSGLHEFSGCSTPYLQSAKQGVVDGIGREHIQLFAECSHCNKKILVAQYHKPRA